MKNFQNKYWNIKNIQLQILKKWNGCWGKFDPCSESSLEMLGNSHSLWILNKKLIDRISIELIMMTPTRKFQVCRVFFPRSHQLKCLGVKCFLQVRGQTTRLYQPVKFLSCHFLLFSKSFYCGNENELTKITADVVQIHPFEWILISSSLHWI